MDGGLSLEQEARVLACHDAHGAAVDSALGDYPFPDDRMAHIGTLEDAGRVSGSPVELLVAWMHRVITDDTVRPLHGDLELRWPSRPDPDDVALVLALAADPACWYYEIRAALQLAERALAKAPATDELVAGLLGLRHRMSDDRLHSSEFFRAKALPWVLRLIAETTPGELPDLAFIDPGDAWAPVVIEAVHAADDPGAIGRALLHLTAPRGGKAPRPWWVRTEQLLVEHRALAVVATELLDALTTVDLTERDDERDGWDVPEEFLLTPANELLARGMAWALRLPPPDDRRCDVLGRVVLRSAAMVFGGSVTHRMLCPKLAPAAIDSLLAIDSDAARAQLGSLVREVRVPALIRRIGPSVGLGDDEIAELVSGLRRRGPLPRPDR